MINALILAVLVKVNLSFKSPWVATGIYTGLAFVLSLLFGYSIWAVLFGAVINLGLSFLFFWLLKKFEETPNFWPIAIVGVLLFLGIGFI